MSRLYVIFSIFCLAYYPQFNGINLIHICTLISYAILFFNFNAFIKTIQKRTIFMSIFYIAIICLYLIGVVTINQSSVRDILPIIYILFEVIPISLSIIIISKRRKGNWNTFIYRNILFVSILQSIIAVIAFIFPSFQDSLISAMGTSNSEILVQLSDHRLYGFSSALTYAMPVFQSMVMIFVLTSNLNLLNKTIYSLLLAFSGLINARVTIVVILIGFILLLVYYFKNPVLKIALFGALAITVLMFIQFDPINITTINTNNQTFEWILDGFNEIAMFLRGDFDQGYFSYVTNENVYVLPEGIHLMLGHGIRIMSRNNIFGVQSDVGYINDLWLGGIIYALLIYGFVFRMLYLIRSKMLRLGHARNISNFSFAFMIMALLVLNFKGYIFSYNSVINILILVFLAVMVTDNNQQNSRVSRG